MAKTAAWIFGVVFVLIGILGFIPNSLFGPSSLFEAGTLLGLVHIILGALLVWAAMKMPEKSAKALLWVGVIYLVIAILGFIWKSFLGLADLNGADNWLHLVFAALLILISWSDKKDMSAPPAPAPQM